MTGRLQDRIAVVTGANAGIGRAIAVAYAQEGATIICANRRPDSSTPGEQEIPTHDLIVKNGGKAEYIQTVISDWNSTDAMFEKLKEKYGRIDILVNCAADTSGMEKWQAFWDMSEDDFQATTGVTFGSTFHCAQVAARIMKDQDPLSCGDRGWIINIGAAFCAKSAPEAVAYTAAKSAVVSMTKSMAAALASFRVHTSVLHPGTTRTAKTIYVPSEVMKMVESKQPFGIAEPKDIARAAVFLASEDAKMVSGTELWADGGYSLT